MNNNLYKIEKQSQLREQVEEKIRLSKLPKSISIFLLRVRSSNSMLTYWNATSSFLTWKFGTLNVDEDDLKQINYIDYKNYVDHLVSQNKYSQSTINSRIAIISALSKHFYLLGITDKDLVQFVNLHSYKFKVKCKERKMPTEADMKLLESNFNNINNFNRRYEYCLIYDIFKIIGLRLSELVGLDIEDVHFNSNCSYLMILRKGSYTLQQKEKVYITDTLEKKIKQWLSLRVNYNPNTEALFLSPSGNRLSIRAIQDMFKRYSDGKITVHMLRHYASTMMYKATNDLAFVQEQMGHSVGSDITMNTYITGLESTKKLLKQM